MDNREGARSDMIQDLERLSIYSSQSWPAPSGRRSGAGGSKAREPNDRLPRRPIWWHALRDSNSRPPGS